MIDSASYHKDIDLGKYDNFSGKDTVAYGKNWFELIQDGDVLTIAILAKVNKSKSASIEIINDSNKQIIIFSSCDWDKDLAIESLEGITFGNNKSIPVNFLIFESISEVESVAQSLDLLGPYLKKEMMETLSTENLTDKYIESRYPLFFHKCMGENMISHIDAQFKATPEDLDFLRLEAHLELRAS